MSVRLIIVFAGLIGAACPVWAAAEPLPAGASASNLTLDVSKLRLASVNALVLDATGGQPIYAKGADTITPIASVTKLMTAMPTRRWTRRSASASPTSISSRAAIRACDSAASCRAARCCASR